MELRRFALFSIICLGVSEIVFSQNRRELGNTSRQASAVARSSTQESRQDNIRLPILGFITSNSPVNLRPILGKPGAVVLGDPIVLPPGISNATVAPGQAYALVEQEGAANLGILPLGITTSGDLQPIPYAMRHADRIEFSPTGLVAVVYSARLQQAQVITGLPSSGQISHEIDLSPLSGVPVTSLAVSDDAQAVLVGVSDGTSGVVWLVAGQQPAQELMSLGLPSALRFFAAKQDAVVADSGWKQILLLTRVGQQMNSRLLAGQAQGISTPADVGISTDQQRVWVADTGSSGLWSVALSSRAVTALDCPFAPAVLMPLAGTSVYLVRTKDDGNVGVWAPEGASTSVWRLPAQNQFDQ